jgi:hypothetical protein
MNAFVYNNNIDDAGKKVLIYSRVEKVYPFQRNGCI